MLPEEKKKEFVLPTKEGEAVYVAHIVKGMTGESDILVETYCGLMPSPIVSLDKEPSNWGFASNEERMDKKVSICGPCRVKHPEYKAF